MPITRVKICGITRPEDASHAVKYGAEFIGLNFFRGPRKISYTQAQTILDAMPYDAENVQTRIVSLISTSLSEDYTRIRKIFGKTGRLFFCQEYGRTPELARQQIEEGYAVVTTLIAHRNTFARRFLQRLGLLHKLKLGPLSYETREAHHLWLPIPVQDRSSMRGLANFLDSLLVRPGVIILDSASTSASAAPANPSTGTGSQKPAPPENSTASPPSSSPAASPPTTSPTPSASRALRGRRFLRRRSSRQARHQRPDQNARLYSSCEGHVTRASRPQMDAGVTPALPSDQLACKEGLLHTDLSLLIA